MKITEVKFQKITNEDTKVLVRVDIHFEEFWLKGFKIIRDPETKKEYLTPPSYRSPKGWRAIFATDEENEWQKIRGRVLDEYNQYLMKQSADEVKDKSLSYK